MFISEVAFWKDTGYQEGAYRVPVGPDSLPVPDMVYSVAKDIHPPRSDLMVSMSLPIDWSDLCLMTYLRVTINDNGKIWTYYGWIDSVDQVSGSSNANTKVSWHVDLWMTWFSGAVFGSGVVMRRKSSGELPPQPYPFRYREVDETFEQRIASPDAPIAYRTYWVYLSINQSTEGGIVYNKMCCFPIRSTGYAYKIQIGGETFDCPKLSDVINGSWDEVLGLDPNAIKSAFVSPYEPNVYTISGDTVSMEGWDGFKFNPSGVARAVFTTQFYATTSVKARVVEFDGPVTSTDTMTVSLLGFDQEVIGSVPWGVTIDRIQYRVILGSSSAYIEVRGGNGANEFDDAHALGVCWTVPMIPLENTSNALSAYRYTGARNADIYQTVLEADKARVNGYMGVAGSAINGVIGGAMTGNLAGAAIGGVAGTASSIATTEIGYRYAIGEFMDRAIGITEYAAANQTNGLITSGSGFDFMDYGRVLTFRRLINDAYSIMIRNDDMDIYGAHVDEPTLSCEDLIRAGGPLQIANLQVTGQIPNQARNYIKGRIAGGVIIE